MPRQDRGGPGDDGAAETRDQRRDPQAPREPRANADDQDAATHDATSHAHDTTPHALDAASHAHDAAAHAHDAATRARDSAKHTRDAASHNAASHAHDAASHAHDSATHARDAATHARDSATDARDAVTHAREAAAHTHDAAAHAHGAAAHGGMSHDDHAATRHGDRKRLLGAIVVTTLILCAEVVGGLMSHSLALLSDAGHMLSDVVAQALSLAALVIAARPADARRTYGWHRVEILAALGNGITLVVLSLIIIWQAWQRLHAPHEVHTGLMMAIAGIGLIANLIGAALLHHSHSLNVKGAYLHILGDTLSSVAVLAGGAVMFFAHGLYRLDPILSIAIGVFILYSSYSLIREAVDVLLETVPRDIDLAGVTHAIDGMPLVKAVHDLHIWTITSGLHALSAHIVVGDCEADARDRLISDIKRVLSERFRISHTTLQVESDSYDHTCHVC